MVYFFPNREANKRCFHSWTFETISDTYETGHKSGFFFFFVFFFLFFLRASSTHVHLHCKLAKLWYMYKAFLIAIISITIIIGLLEYFIKIIIKYLFV